MRDWQEYPFKTRQEHCHLTGINSRFGPLELFNIYGGSRASLGMVIVRCGQVVMGRLLCSSQIRFSLC